MAPPRDKETVPKPLKIDWSIKCHAKVREQEKRTEVLVATEVKKFIVGHFCLTLLQHQTEQQYNSKC